MQSDFRDLLKLDALSLFDRGALFTRWPYKREMSHFYIRGSNVGNRASDFFHRDARYQCDSINSPSPARTWGTEKFRMTLLGALWSLKCEQVTSKELMVAIHLRKYVASQFRPSAAKAIYKLFDSSRTLDFSAGWGDRLAAFSAHGDSGDMYVGIDPNDRVYAKYVEQMNWHNSLSGRCPIGVFYNKPAEEIVDGFESEFFDLVFTSPPYFNAERYTQDDRQSWKRYRKLDVWLSKFLFPVIEGAWRSLAVGGAMVINIADVYSGHKVNKICDPMNDFIESIGGSYMGCIGLQMAKRPNSRSDADGTFVEPMWVWGKGRSEKVDEIVSETITGVQHRTKGMKLF